MVARRLLPATGGAWTITSFATTVAIREPQPVASPDGACYIVEDLGDDAISVLCDYGIRQAHLVGMSLGGYLCQIVGLKYAERAAS